MSDTDDSGQWFSIYVPPADATNGATPSPGVAQSYIRLGAPDTVREENFKATLEANYASDGDDLAVQATFGGATSGGIVLYTDGDLVQFVGGKCDTRVLDDSFSVQVLSKSEVDDQNSTDQTPTYCSYLRLGKPNVDIEGAFESQNLIKPIPGSELYDYVMALAPPPPTNSHSVIYFVDQINEAVSGSTDAQSDLYNAALGGDPGALQAIEDIRVMSSETVWSTSSLRALQFAFATDLQTQAAQGDSDARQRLEDRATTAKDPIVIRRLGELATGDYSQDTTKWATGVLKKINADKPSLQVGSGVVLYSDGPVSVTTPQPFKVTVASDSRTVLGESYVETYSVKPSDLQNIQTSKTLLTELPPDRKLVTAMLTHGSGGSGDYWRTIKFDRTNALTFNVQNTGTFALSSTYAFTGGLKVSNGLTASFDGSAALAVSIASLLKVEIGPKKNETTWLGGKVSYNPTVKTYGNQIEIAATGQEVAVGMLEERLSKAFLAATVVTNVLVTLFTAVPEGIADHGVKTDGGNSTQDMRGFLQKSEPIYVTIASVNLALWFLGIVVGIIQLLSKTPPALAGKPTISVTQNGIYLTFGDDEVAIDRNGILLSAGGEYIRVSGQGITASAAVVNLAAPQVQVQAQAQDDDPLLDFAKGT